MQHGFAYSKKINENIKETIYGLNKTKKALDLKVKDYKIFTQAEMEENVDICID